MCVGVEQAVRIAYLTRRNIPQAWGTSDPADFTYVVQLSFAVSKNINILIYTCYGWWTGS
jgi:hypothetical protein